MLNGGYSDRLRRTTLLSYFAGLDHSDAPPTQLSDALWPSGGERRPASKRPAVVLVPVPPSDADGQSSKFRGDAAAEGLELYSR